MEEMVAIHQPIIQHPIIPATTAWLDGPRRPASRDPPREPPATAEGLGSIVIGGNEEQTSDPPQEVENRSPSMGTIGRVLSAISNIGRGPQAPRPTRGRSADRTQGGAPPPPQGESDGDSSSYGSDVRTHQNPVAQEPRIPAGQRPEVPIPPSFHEDLFMAAFQMGAAVQAQQAQFLAQAGGFNIGTPPPAPNQPQGEPDPEQPGAGEPPSEQDTTTGAETTDDDSDAETLSFNEGEDRSDYPENTDTDPYEDAENPTGSQAEAEQAPDIEHIDIDDSHNEEAESEVIPEQPSQGDETPKAAVEAAAGVPPEPITTEKEKSKPSKPPAPMGRIDAFTGSIGDWYKLKNSPPQESKKPSPAEPKHGKSPEKKSLATAGEQSAPQVSSSEAASSKEDKEQPSNPTQGEGGSSSTSQAAPAETSAAASEDPKPASSEQKKSEAKAVDEPALRTLNRRRKPINKPRQETKEEKEERERLEKIADVAAKQSAAELIAQEEQEKKKLSDREAKAKQAAAANTEKARDAADRMKKKKEADKAEEKVPRAVT